MIELSVAGAIATVALARPSLNALTPEWVTRFNEVLDTIESKPDVTVVRIRSSERVFCAGADLAFMTANFASAAGRSNIHAFVVSVQRAFTRLESLSVTSIAQIEGPAVGGGLELALACDFRIIADTASVAFPEVNLGLIPGAGGTQRLTRIAGPSVARRLILGGRPVLGAEAVSLRICDWVEHRSDVDGAAAVLASRISVFPRDAMAACRRCITAAGSRDGNGFQEELDATAMLLESPTTHERVRAFLERNAARRTGGKD